jgi:hypothetical protein
MSLSGAVIHCDILFLFCIGYQCDCSDHCSWYYNISILNPNELKYPVYPEWYTEPDHLIICRSHELRFFQLPLHSSVTHSHITNQSYSFFLRKQKGEKITIWERNFQLAFWSILLLLTIVGYERFQTDLEADFSNQIFFRGWTINTVMIALIQAVSTSLSPNPILSCHLHYWHSTEPFGSM